MTEERRTLTTRQGHPVSDNQSLRSVGERGPATLGNYRPSPASLAEACCRWRERPLPSCCTPRLSRMPLFCLGTAP